MRGIDWILDRLGVAVVDWRIYPMSHFSKEGGRRFACMRTPEAARIVQQYHAKRQRRMHWDTTYLVKIAYWLGIPKLPPMTIVDIGSSSGMWPYLCKTYGHTAFCTDLPTVLERPEVKAMIDLFGVPSFPLRIEPLKPLELSDRTFDFVTGFRTRFHSTKPEETGLENETHWGVDEWDFFLRNIAEHMPRKGQIFLLLNRLQPRPPGGVPRHLARYFREVGGTLTGMSLLFRDVSRLKAD